MIYAFAYAARERPKIIRFFVIELLTFFRGVLAFIGALQALDVPNIADLFNSANIEAAATITNEVSVLINLQTITPICAFRLLRTSSAKRKQNTSPRSRARAHHSTRAPRPRAHRAIWL